MRNNKGFSLVELIVVIAIMAILAAVAIPTFAGFITKANEASDISFMNDVEYAIELAHAAEVNNNIKSITVNIASDGKTITNIVYTMDAGTPNDDSDDQQKTVSGAGTDDVSKTLDMTYNFKAAKTVDDNQNWNDGVWTIVIATASNNQ